MDMSVLYEEWKATGPHLDLTPLAVTERKLVKSYLKLIKYEEEEIAMMTSELAELERMEEVLAKLREVDSPPRKKRRSDGSESDFGESDPVIEVAGEKNGASGSLEAQGRDCELEENPEMNIQNEMEIVDEENPSQDEM